MEGRCTGKLNLIPGFDFNTGDYREYKRILKEFGIPYTILADICDTFESPCDGTYHIYPGGTKLDDAADSINGKATIALGPYATPKTFGWIKDNYSGKHVSMPMPMGIEKTDAFIMKIAELFGKEVPASLKNERGRAVDAMTDSHQYMHGKKFAVYGDPGLPDRLCLLPAGDGRPSVPHPLQQGQQEGGERDAGAAGRLHVRQRVHRST